VSGCFTHAFPRQKLKEETTGVAGPQKYLKEGRREGGRKGRKKSENDGKREGGGRE